MSHDLADWATIVTKKWGKSAVEGGWSCSNRGLPGIICHKSEGASCSKSGSCHKEDAAAVRVVNYVESVASPGAVLGRHFAPVYTVELPGLDLGVEHRKRSPPGKGPDHRGRRRDALPRACPGIRRWRCEPTGFRRTARCAARRRGSRRRSARRRTRHRPGAPYCPWGGRASPSVAQRDRPIR